MSGWNDSADAHPGSGAANSINDGGVAGTGPHANDGKR
jgi:hypothetical protein